MIIMALFFLKAHCYEMTEGVNCGVSEFWEKGFVAFQASINAAIIEVSIKHPKQTHVQCR